MAGLIKSILKESIKNLPEQNIKAESVLPTLLKKGVKQEEIDFSGVTESLPKTGKVSKQQLVEAEAKRKDKFYVTEGGEHYKSISLPEGQTNPTYREKIIQFREKDKLEAEIGEEWGSNAPSRYTSPHFPEDENYLAHTRVFDTDMDGKPTRVLQEMQSDLHQTGRQYGYGEVDTTELQTQYDKYIQARDAYDNADEVTVELDDALELEKQKLEDIVVELDRTAYDQPADDAAEAMLAGEWQYQGTTGNVPKSPYEKTWLAKTIEREVVDAVNEGRSQLAIPIKGSGIENLHRGEGVQKWYESTVVDTARKIAKRAGAEFEIVGKPDDTMYAVIKPTGKAADKPIEFALYSTPAAAAFATYQAYKAGYTDEQVNEQLVSQGYEDEEISEINSTAEKIAQAEAAGYTPEEINQFLGGQEIVPTVKGSTPAPIEIQLDTGTATAEAFNKLTAVETDMDPKEFVTTLETYLPIAVSSSTSIASFFGNEAATQRLQAANESAKARAIKLAKDKFGIDLVRMEDPGTKDMAWFISTDQGYIPATRDSLDEWMSIGSEIAFVTGSAIVGGRVGFNTAPPSAPFVGPLSKPIGGAIGAFVGGLLSDAAYQNVDYMYSALQLQEDLESATLKHINLTALENAAIGEVIGFGLVKTVGVTGKVLKAAKNKVLGGNIDGAYKALKDTTFLDDSQLQEIVKTLEDFGGELPAKTPKEKAIQAYSLTQPGGQDLVNATSSVEAQASKAVSYQVTRRAEDFINTVEDLTDPNVAKRFQQDLLNYTMDVKANYGNVKKLATQTPRGLNFKWDYDKLAIEPVLDALTGKLGLKGTATVVSDPTLQKFLTQANKIRTLSDSRGFGDLLEMRQLVNDFLYNKKIAKADGKGLLRSVLANIDEAIVDGAPQVVDNPKEWLKRWSGARTDYTKMKAVERTAIHRMMFDQKGKMRPVQPESVVKALGKYTTALDGSFETVMSELPVSGRNMYENAVIKNATDKFTVSAKDGTKAINFPKLAEELGSINFTAPEGRALKKTIEKIAEVFKNDVSLFSVSNTYNKLNVSQGLSADLSAKAKYSLMAKVWDKMQTITGFGRGAREVALVENAAKLLEHPLDSVASKEIMEQFKQSPDILREVRKMQEEAARSQAKGKDLVSPRVHVDATGKIMTGGAKGAKTIPAHRIATLEQVKNIADASGVTVDSKSITQILKNNGYVAVMQGSDRVKDL